MSSKTHRPHAVPKRDLRLATTRALERKPKVRAATFDDARAVMDILDRVQRGEYPGLAVFQMGRRFGACFVDRAAGSVAQTDGEGASGDTPVEAIVNLMRS